VTWWTPGTRSRQARHQHSLKLPLSNQVHTSSRWSQGQAVVGLRGMLMTLLMQRAAEQMLVLTAAPGSVASALMLRVCSRLVPPLDLISQEGGKR